MSRSKGTNQGQGDQWRVLFRLPKRLMYHMFRNLHVFPASCEGRETPLLGPLEKVSLSHSF
jgi:hypothetical protein